MNNPSLQNWITKWLSKERLPSDFSVSALAGDGSTRQFFRLLVPKSPKEKSFVVLQDPSWTLSKDYEAHQKFLTDHQIPVPRFFGVDPKEGFLVMEDLGDTLLQMEMEKKPTTKFDWLVKATKLIAKLHGEAFPVSPNIPAATRRFDQKKYSEELGFTFEHLHHKLLGLEPVSPGMVSKVSEFCLKLEGISPEVFCHRDYHCRNLLVFNGSIFMIDFQDARLGSPQYDLASLLYDAYVPIEPHERAKLVELYKREVQEYALNDAIEWDKFSTGLSLVAIQRTMKAAGSFASFYTRYQKKTHLKYLTPALRYSIALRDSLDGETASLIKEIPLEKWIERFESLQLT